MGLFSRQPVDLSRSALLSAADLDEVRFLIGNRKIIHAVKLVRDRTGLDLKSAKQLVDDVADGRFVHPAAAAPAAPAASAEVPPAVPPARGAGLAERVRALKASGDWHVATRMVAVETGMTDAEAAAFVAALGQPLT